MDASLEPIPQEWHLELRECNSHVARVLAVVVVYKATKVTRQALVGRFKLHVQYLRALEYIAVLIVGSDAETQVSLAVSTLKRERDSL